MHKTNNKYKIQKNYIFFLCFNTRRPEIISRIKLKKKKNKKKHRKLNREEGGEKIIYSLARATHEIFFFHFPIGDETTRTKNNRKSSAMQLLSRKLHRNLLYNFDVKNWKKKINFYRCYWNVILGEFRYFSMRVIFWHWRKNVVVFISSFNCRYPVNRSRTTA